MLTTHAEITVPGQIGSARLMLDPQLRQPNSIKPSPGAKAETSLLNIARDNASNCRIVLPGMELFAEGETGDNLYVVLDGWMFMHRILEDGRRQILDFALPGAVLGYHAFPDAPFAFSAEAITNAEVAVIPINRLNKLLQDGSNSATILLEAAHDALLSAFDTLTDIGRRTAREAVAHFLLRMERRVRHIVNRDPDGSVSFPLNQEHIGDALGLTSVHVCRTLSRLRKDGLVDVGHGRLRIPEVDALAEDAAVYCSDYNVKRLVN